MKVRFLYIEKMRYAEGLSAIHPFQDSQIAKILGYNLINAFESKSVDGCRVSLQEKEN